MKIILSYIMATIILLFLLALPIAGVVAYIRLIRKMRREQITAIPKFSLFMLFLICGTLLMEILLGISGMWSGASTARFIVLLFVAPALCGMIAWRHRHHSEISKYHCTILHAALGYLLGEAVLIGAVSLFIIGELAYMALIG